MQCPFLKGINFKKITEIAHDDYSLLDFEMLTECQNLTLDDNEFIIPQENVNIGIVQSHCAHPNPSLKPKKIYLMETNNSSRNMMPKPLITKHLIQQMKQNLPIIPIMQPNRNTLAKLMLNQQRIISVQQVNSLHLPQFSCKKTNLFCDFQKLFRCFVYVNNEIQKSECIFKQRILKITKRHQTKCFINFKKVKCKIKQKELNLQITIKTNDKQRILNIKLETKIEKQKLMKYMQNAQGQAINDENNYSLGSIGYQVERVTIEKLMKQANTFDMLLFKNKSMISKVQRLFTNSDYDHAALILRTTNSYAFVLDCGGSAGVAIYTLSSILSAKARYSRIGIRYYRGERTQTQIDRLQSFLQQAVGKKYKFDPMYLFSCAPKTEETYFCSELVVEALKKAQIVQDKRPSYKYLPKHLAEYNFNHQLSVGQYSDVVLVQ